MENIVDSRTEGFLARLRSKTDVSHKRLEALPLSQLLMDPTIKIGDYTLYLTLMHDVVAQMEADVYPLLQDVVPDLEERIKTNLLLADLKVLGIQKATTTNVFDSQIITNQAFAMGMLYVLEGSTLGGRFILKNITEKLGFDASEGAAYFAGYGNKTGSSWKKFLNIFTAFEAGHEAETSIIAGADYAFKAIEVHLSQTPV